MSSVAVMNRSDALRQTALSLGILSAAGDAPALNQILIAQSLRRTVYIAAPCGAQTTRSLALAALAPLCDNPDTLNEQIDDALQDIIAMGDVLEMRSGSVGCSDTVLRPAPPAFVARPDGLFLILGISGDELTPALRMPVLHHASGLRSTRSTDAEQCRSLLLDLGLTELSERVWLHTPATASAAEHAAQWKARLPAELRPEKIENFEVLHGALPASFYKRRWSLLNTKHSGIFIARRPQRYGAKLWCLADVKDGLVQRFVDIHAKDSLYTRLRRSMAVASRHGRRGRNTATARDRRARDERHAIILHAPSDMGGAASALYRRTGVCAACADRFRDAGGKHRPRGELAKGKALARAQG